MTGNSDTARRVVELAYEAMSRQNLDEWQNYFAPDVTLFELPELPDARTYRGRDEVRQWAETQLTSVSEWQWTPEEFLFNDGTTLVVRVLLTGRSVAGVPIEMTVFHAFEMRDDKLALVHGFLSEAQARTAAGVSAEP